ncbi:MAG: extracellular solute-binding protein [Clostridiales bacterium]|nr:extracellular solute-binding protein [Clostridiales bacterium]
MKLKKILTLALAAVLAGTALASCAAKGFDKDGAITVISREKGSGTRSAFIELFGVEVDKEDKTVETADITDKTNVMMTSVSQNANAIGYISLGSLNDSVKALKIDGAAATVENIENGSYKISRPFNIATKSEPSEAAADFIAFILSDEGQKVVKDNGYIPVKTNGAYNGSKPSGKISIGGSSSVTPVMEKLKEAYNAVNPNVTIEINMTDSSSGMTSVAEGVCDIGMASRAVKQSELDKGLVPTTIATDGIAVIVNLENTFDALTADQVRRIYIGELTTWSALEE